MDIFSNLATGFGIALSLENLFFVFLGAIIGTIVGALPGIGPASGVALLIPVTFVLNPVTAFVMLAGIYYGAMYGGAISSILINIPGDGASVATTFDGHKMALNGRAEEAISTSAWGSFIGGIISVLLFLVFFPVLITVALSFGPSEYFALMLVGLSTLSALSSKSISRSLIATLFGLILSMVGVDVLTGLPRYHLGMPELFSGIDFIPVAMGLYGIAEVLITIEEDSKLEMLQMKAWRGVFSGVRNCIKYWWNVIRTSIESFLLGLLPGAGCTIASIICYSTTKRTSKYGKEMGTGHPVGVLVPEVANNVAAVGSMVPLLTLGIPGSATTAVMMGALMLHGVRPGPMILQEHPDIVWTLIASMFIGNFILVILNTAGAPLFAKLLNIPSAFLSPLIVVIAILGVYTLQNSMFDVMLMLIFGIVGYFMNKLDYPKAPVVLAIILGDMMESSLRQALIIGDNSIWYFVSRPITLALIIISIVLIAMPQISGIINKIRSQATEDI